MVIVKSVMSYLKSYFAATQSKPAIPVLWSKPESNTNPEMQTFILVDHTGGSRRDNIRHATIAIQTYAPTAQKAAELAEEVLAAMDALPGRDTITAADLNAGPYSFPITATKQPRYQAVYEITYRGD